MPKKKNVPSRRRYDDDFKAEAVQMLLDGHSASSVASRLGLSSSNILVILAVVAQRYKVVVDTEDRHQMAAAMTMNPKYGVQVRLQRR